MSGGKSEGHQDPQNSNHLNELTILVLKGDALLSILGWDQLVIGWH